MKKFEYTPKIRLCPQCKQHGHFTLPGAEYSLEFYSIAGAMKIAQSEHICFRLHSSEIEKLKALTTKCALPPSDSEAVTKVVLDVESWNEEFGAALEIGAVLQYAAHNHYNRTKISRFAKAWDRIELTRTS